MYFKKFPNMIYESEDGIYTIVKDITFNVRIRKDTLKQIALYEVYTVKDGETPEKIAEKIYGNPNYHWVILLANEIYDWVTEFPLTQQEFEEYLDDKYEDEAPLGIRGSVYARSKISHHENYEGQIVQFNPALDAEMSSILPSFSYYNPDLTEPKAVTLYDVEERLNEQNRRIKVISPRVVDQVISAFSMVG